MAQVRRDCRILGLAVEPVCPVESNPPEPQCAPRPGVARIRVLRADGNAAAAGASVGSAP